MIRRLITSLVAALALITPAAVIPRPALAVAAVPPGPLTDQEVEELFAWMASQPDIAFQYAQDGCYARAHLMIRRMQSRGINPRKVWAIAAPGDSLFVGTPYDVNGVVQWQYHVAPIVPVHNEVGVVLDVVIDPSMFEGPVSIIRWRREMQSRSQRVWLTTTRIGEPPVLPTGVRAMGTGYWPGPDPSPDLDGFSLELMRRYSTGNGGGNNGNGFGNSGNGFGNNGNGLCSNCGNYPCTCGNAGIGNNPVPLKVTKRIDNPPLPPAKLVFVNTHAQELVVQLIDKRHPNERPIELSIPAGQSREQSVDRDAGGRLARMLLDPNSGQPIQELGGAPIPPKELYDVVVYESKVTYTYYDRTLKGPEKHKPQMTRSSLRSIGVFPLPAGDRINDGARVDVYRDAAYQSNPGAAARFPRPSGMQ